MQQENRPLTAIRGVAALWVVAHHVQAVWAPSLAGFAGQAVRLGYLAVDVFFVLSGFIMVLVYGPIAPRSATQFWWRRVLRVYPLHITIMAALALKATVASLHNPALPAHPWREFPALVLLLQSYLLPDSPWNPPTWSVGVELSCYLLFPFVMPLLRRLPAGALIALALLLGFAEWQVLAVYGGTITGLGAMSRGLAGFALGAALAQLMAARLAAPISAWRAGLGETVAVAGILAGIAADTPPLIALSAALLIVALSTQSGPLARLLSLRGFVWLGAVSFSIYLLHAPILGLMEQYLPLRAHGFARWFILLAVLLPLSGLTWRYIEQPGRRLAWRGPIRPVGAPA